MIFNDKKYIEFARTYAAYVNELSTIPFKQTIVDDFCMRIYELL